MPASFPAFAALQFSELTTDNMILREAREAGPSKSTLYEYSYTTSTSSLRPHIEKYHLDLYQTLAKANGWTVYLPGLVSQAKSQAVSEVTTQGEQRDKFDVDTFHQHLLNFIIADDQVCTHLVFYVYNPHVCVFRLWSL